MNRLIVIGVSIIVGETLVLGIAKLFGSPDTIYIHEMMLFTAAFPLGAIFVAIGLLRAARGGIRGDRPMNAFDRWLFQQTRPLAARSQKLFEGAKSHRGWLKLSIALYVLGLFLPFESDSRMSSLGLQKLYFGWMFVLTGETLVWFSFLFTFAAWTVMRPGRASAAIAFSALALIVALPFLFGPSITYGWGDSLRAVRQHPEVGYFLLLASAAAALVGSLKVRVLEQGPDSTHRTEQ